VRRAHEYVEHFLVDAYIDSNNYYRPHKRYKDHFDPYDLENKLLTCSVETF
jgi:hypothetical protein